MKLAPRAGARGGGGPLGVLVLVLAVVLVAGWLLVDKQPAGRLPLEPEPQAPPAPMTYVAPVQSIDVGMVITAEMVRAVSLQEGRLIWPSLDESRARYPSELEQVIGRVALADLRPGEMIRHERIASPDEADRLAGRLGPGRGALTVMLATSPQPGDRVDLVGRDPTPGAPAARPVAVGALVLGVDGEAPAASAAQVPRAGSGTAGGRPPAAAPVESMVTLEVAPGEVEAVLAMAGGAGLSWVPHSPAGGEGGGR